MPGRATQKVSAYYRPLDQTIRFFEQVRDAMQALYATDILGNGLQFHPNGSNVQRARHAT